MSLPLLTIPLVNAVVFWAYGDAKRVLGSASSADRAELPLWMLTLAGAYAGIVNGIIAAPVDLVKVQLQAQVAEPATWAASGGKYFSGPTQWAKHAYAAGGWRAALQGFVPTIVREVPAYAGQFYVYEVSGCCSLVARMLCVPR